MNKRTAVERMCVNVCTIIISVHLPIPKHFQMEIYFSFSLPGGIMKYFTGDIDIKPGQYTKPPSPPPQSNPSPLPHPPSPLPMNPPSPLLNPPSPHPNYTRSLGRNLAVKGKLGKFSILSQNEWCRWLGQREWNYSKFVFAKNILW